MSSQVPVSDDSIVDQGDEGPLHLIGNDLAYLRLAIVNAVFYGRDAGLSDEREAGNSGTSDGWVLIDAGVAGSAGRIRRAAAQRFGADQPPVSIILTHGHFDHVGSLHELLSEWNVPVYAHALELPFLTGERSYPPPDPSVGGGLMARTSPLFPDGPFDFSKWIRPLPDDGAVPGMPRWRWLHTPGHAPGHVSLWRAADRTLIAGDAFITTKQESAYAVLKQEPEIHGPPTYYTPDWGSARLSVQRLAALEPEAVVTGHGRALHGEEMRTALHLLADNFDAIAIPKHGRYVHHMENDRDIPD